MSTTTIGDQLAEIRRRIVRLQVLAQTGAPRIQRHLDALHQEEAAVRVAVRRAPDEVEEKLGQLMTRLAVAENSLAADASDDWTTFAAAVEYELHSWGTYLERLQARVGRRLEGARAGRGGDRRRPQPTDRGRHRLAQVRDYDVASRTKAEEHASQPATSSNRRPPNCPRS